MATLTFKKQFAPLVSNGQKKQTIRRKKIVKFRVGEKLYCFTGLRRKDCKRLGEFKIKSVQTLNFAASMDLPITSIIIDGQRLTVMQAYELAQADGFKNITEMTDWFLFHYGKEIYQTDFWLIKWE